MRRYEMEPRPADLGGDVRLKLFDDEGAEAEGGAFPALPDEAESDYAEATADAPGVPASNGPGCRPERRGWRFDRPRRAAGSKPELASQKTTAICAVDDRGDRRWRGV